MVHARDKGRGRQVDMATTLQTHFGLGADERNNMDANKLPKTLRQYAALIVDFSDERQVQNGYWVYLVYGYINERSETHQIHEDTLAECANQLRHWVKPCACAECAEHKTVGR